MARPDVGGASRLLLRERRGVAIPLVGCGALEDLTSRSGVLSRLWLRLRGVGESPEASAGAGADIAGMPPVCDLERAAIFLAQES